MSGQKTDDPCDDWSGTTFERLNDKGAPVKDAPEVDVEVDQTTDKESRVAARARRRISAASLTNISDQR